MKRPRAGRTIWYVLRAPGGKCWSRRRPDSVIIRRWRRLARGHTEGAEGTIPSAPIPVGFRLASLGQVATDGRLDLRAGVAVVQANLNQLLARDDQVGLRGQHVEQRTSAERVPLVVDAKG